MNPPSLPRGPDQSVEFREELLGKPCGLPHETPEFFLRVRRVILRPAHPVDTDDRVAGHRALLGVLHPQSERDTDHAAAPWGPANDLRGHRPLLPHT